MSTSPAISDSARFSGQKMSFSHTCNLLSQYVKEKRALGISANLDSRGKTFFFLFLFTIDLSNYSFFLNLELILKLKRRVVEIMLIFLWVFVYCGKIIGVATMNLFTIML